LGLLFATHTRALAGGASSSISKRSFVPNMASLIAALAWLKKHDVALEDPGDEIGPEAPGSANVGL